MTSEKETTRERFDRQVREQGGAPAYDEWLGTHKPHKVICEEGHECNPWPSSVRRGRGICRKCSGNDPVQAEEEFRSRVIALGGTPVFDKWRGVMKPHRVICEEGHECNPWPSSVRRGRGICRRCARQDPEHAEEEFRSRVTALGGIPVFDEWLGTGKPHKVICKEGHAAVTRPTHVQQGRGICRKCAGREWDVFYITFSPVKHEVKFGITSGNPAPRLADHKADGFTEVLYLRTEFPGAYDLECKVKIGLLDAGFEPVQGREYFRDTALPFILSMVSPAEE